ncbi:MAG: bifunctional diaminohydroxyphosphoribosylaminopyrimidine deaminase/5-amino-6-(5-phosphoribosylamino)uracil reductase RibD [Lentisphaerae bacterium]|nr:bifunctional diaminohydroxyphosphoribosylaminopyrimidine deaminase/5-amino-6-(5-phosphoribosylamino)uracil reductase RibD [Lentisphaerota bacterium]MBT4815888.1 bifunctional diaminohydroxyphosphoribosylaminopyrimidine deaminase/5-amino-6-(5-phosphoribosylamino)uracil reductase RibD [Lentisphaerota bacterium]MBT5610422.1 bifunctional diaminohydroxyphosphoribosylaminopyrimidine deaminase/5-amino-6-(5-phosphoribosylamino)uracil reductase RibD [Lentisphaerota bacterium]MBT7061676.1 bifunctional d
MRRALSLAKRAWGRTSPNPMVGSVVVQKDREVGAGYHHQAGQPHAEVNALRDAGSAARDADVFVTLEPCCTHGRTPPCTEALIEAGARRVVIGCLDPNPAHAGRAVTILQEAGIEVVSGVQEQSCQELNEAFFHWIQTGRPFVLLKMAMTLDGKIATAGGDSKWVTGPKARAHVQRLRRWADAIMVGGETVRVDNPSLTVRTPEDWPCQPRKLVWSRRIDFDRRLNVWADPANPPRFAAPDGSESWQDFLAELGTQGVTALLIEGGGELASACLRAGFVDKVAFFIAPKILGGRGSRPVVAGPNPDALMDAFGVDQLKVRHVGPDILLTGYVNHVHRTN